MSVPDVTSTSTTTMSPIWGSLADRFVCINLLERTDRLEQAQQRFNAVGLGEHMTYYRVARHSRGGRYGCYSSHRDCIQQAYIDGLQSVLIFEDDVLFDEGWEKVVHDSQAFVQSGVSFDALFLGSKILFVDEQTTPDIWRVKCFEAHAYSVTRQGMKAYLDGSDTFEKLITDHGQDLIHCSLFQAMHSHSSPSIRQDDALGTDHIWIPELPPEYAEWMQFVVSPAHKEVIKPIVRSNLWQRSWLGRRYIFGIDNYVIDDGRVRLKGLWLVDGIIHAILMYFVCAPPPQGRWKCVKDSITGVAEHWPRRILGSLYYPKDATAKDS